MDRLDFSVRERGYRHFVVLLELEKEVLDESCGNDVEDELALEHDDNPVTQQERTFRFAQNYFPILGQMWLLTTDTLVGKVLFSVGLAK